MVTEAMKKYILSLSFSALNLFFSAPALGSDCQLEKVLTPTQHKRLHRAEKLDRIFLNKVLLGKDVYALDILKAPNNDVVVLLGEAHIKGPRSSIIGKNLTKAFSVKMLEGIPKAEADYIAQNLQTLNNSLGWQRTLLRVLTFNFFGSTITASQKKGITYLPGYSLVLSNRKPLARVPTTTADNIIDHLSGLSPFPTNLNLPLEVGPFLTPSEGDHYILNARNVRMVDNIDQFLNSQLTDGPYLAIVGSAHNAGMRNLLVSKGYQVCKFKKLKRVN